jgi:DNA-binding winged helix-turn-helix (wHTH) protein
VRIGTFVVDLSAREVLDELTGARTRITSKALGVITELAVHPGQVLSRDELMDRVWPGAFPTGDVLTQAVTTLRKAFGDDAEAPRFIETISKSGYRLIAPVQWLPTQVRSAPEMPVADELAKTMSVTADAIADSATQNAIPRLSGVTAKLHRHCARAELALSGENGRGGNRRYPHRHRAPVAAGDRCWCG